MYITPPEHTRHRKTLNILIKLVGKGVLGDVLAEHKRMLDLGCGSGDLTILVAKLLNVNEVYGVDIDEDKAKMAKDKGVIAERCNLNNDKLPFPNNFFDYVTAFDVLEHIVNIDHCLKEVRRVLKDTGSFIFTVPNMASLWGCLELLLGRYPWGLEYSFETMRSRSIKVRSIRRVKPAGHIRGFTLWALEDLLDFHGFKIVHSTGFNISVLAYYLPLLPLTYLRKTLKGHLLIVAKKQ